MSDTEKLLAEAKEKAEKAMTPLQLETVRTYIPTLVAMVETLERQRDYYREQFFHWADVSLVRQGALVYLDKDDLDRLAAGGGE